MIQTDLTPRPQNILCKETVRSADPNHITLDIIFLSFIVVLSLVLYVWELGFYSDDWGFASSFNNSDEPSLFGYFWSEYSHEHVQMRPVQILYLALLYWMFGLNPLGYHLVNAVVLISGVVLFYLVLRRLGQQRVVTFAVPMIYALLPHYSTDRFWIAAFQANLSMVMYFLSLYSDLRASESRAVPFLNWKMLGFVSLVMSVFAYEVFFPMFLFNQILLWYHGRRTYGPKINSRPIRIKLLVINLSNLSIWVLAMAFKALTATRLDSDIGHPIVHYGRIVRRLLSVNYGPYGYGLNIKQALVVNYGDYVLELPYVISRIIRDYTDGATLLISLVVGLAIFGYSYYLTKQSLSDIPSRRTLLELTIGGFFIFWVGYAIFLTTFSVQFTPAGIGNRTAIAAAIGVALSLVGGLGLVSKFLPTGQWQRYFFCTLVGLLGMSYCLINNSIASFWITAYEQQQVVLADISRQLPNLSDGNILILDGICPYIGPAIVFESDWDLAGALDMYYPGYFYRADVVKPNLKIGENGLSLWLYGSKTFYPYENLLIYNYGRKELVELTDADSSDHYFQTFNSNIADGCPEGHEGHGVPIF